MNSTHSRKRVLFRADGSSTIGLGHIYRCLAIAERLSDDFECFFATRMPSSELKNTISRFASLIEIDHYENYIDEAERLVTIIRAYDISIITLDGYFFNTEYQKKIKENCKAIIVSIDDDQPFHYVSDIVINHAGGIEEDRISKEPYTKTFLGYQYLLLRKEFMALRSKEKRLAGIHSVFICFGGADPQDFTGKTLDCLKNEPGIREITIVVGVSYLFGEGLKKTAVHYPHVSVTSNLDATALAELMNRTDMAIVPASTIGLEAFAARMILITGITANNQNNIYKGLEKESTVLGIGEFQTLTCAELVEKINVARHKFNDHIFGSGDKTVDSLKELYTSLV